MASVSRGVVPGSTSGQPRRDHWRALLEAQRRSGLSLAAFCRRRGLRKGTLGFWKWKPPREAGPSASWERQATLGQIEDRVLELKRRK